MLKSRQIHDTFVVFLVGDILSFIENFDFVGWSFVKRRGNRVAHDLAHRQPLCLEGIMWVFEVPDDILSRVSNDMYTYINNRLI